MTATQRTFSALIAIGATISALFLGERVGGPLARAILGPPAGFHEDFTSRAAYGQALLVQGLFVGLAFFLVGAVAALRFKKLSYRDAVWTANPITVGVGFIAYKLANHSLHLWTILRSTTAPKSSYCSALRLRLFSPFASMLGPMRDARATRVRNGDTQLP